MQFQFGWIEASFEGLSLQKSPLGGGTASTSQQKQTSCSLLRRPGMPGTTQYGDKSYRCDSYG